MFCYFIVYTFKQFDKFGDGNIDVTLDEPITKIEHIRDIERGIINKFHLNSCVVQSFQKFDN